MNIIFENAMSLFDSILGVYFITKFNHSPINIRKNKFFLPAIIILFAYTVFSDHVLSGFNLLSTIIFLIMYIAYGIIVSDKHYLRGILSGIIFEIAIVLLSSLLYAIMSLAVTNIGELMQGSDATVRYIYVLIHKVALFALLKLVLFIFKADRDIDLKNGILTFVFSLTTILGLGTAIHIMSGTDARNDVLIISISFVVVNIILYVLIFQIQKLLQDKYELRLMEEKIAFENSRLNDARIIWDDIKKIRHDMKQHLTIISGHLENGEIEGCKDYISELLPDIDHMGKLIISDNKVIDYIINTKLGSLDDTQVIISGSIGDLSDIKETDLACLLGNIIDNAVDATRQANEKRIELFFMRQNSNRIIICKNTTNNSVLQGNRELRSTKHDGHSHGYGTKIIKKIASDYNGMVEFFEDIDMFGVQVLLPDATT